MSKGKTKTMLYLKIDKINIFRLLVRFNYRLNFEFELIFRNLLTGPQYLNILDDHFLIAYVNKTFGLQELLI